MAQLVLKDIDTETAEKLDLRAKRLGTTPEEEASRLLRERLRTEPLPETATTREKMPAIVQEAEALDPEMVVILKAAATEIVKLQEAPAKAKKSVNERHEMEQPFADPRFVRKHEFLVFMGDVTTEQVPDHRVVRDERIDTLLKGIDEGRV